MGTVWHLEKVKACFIYPGKLHSSRGGEIHKFFFRYKNFDVVADISQYNKYVYTKVNSQFSSTDNVLRSNSHMVSEPDYEASGTGFYPRLEKTTN